MGFISMKYATEHTLPLLIFFVTLLLFYVMNTLVPFFSDDLSSLYVEGQHIAGVSDYFAALRYDYLHINGRLLIDGAVLLVVLLGESVFDVVNTLLFALATGLFFRQIGVGGNAFRKAFFLTLTLLGFLSLSTGVDSLFYWAAGASNYVWALIPTLLFLALMNKRRWLQGRAPVVLLMVGMLLSAYNEMYSFPVCAAYLTYFVFHRQELSRPQLFLLSGFVVGSLAMALAPGNFSRQAFYTVGLGVLPRLVKILYSLRLSYILLLTT